MRGVGFFKAFGLAVLFMAASFMVTGAGIVLSNLLFDTAP